MFKKLISKIILVLLFLSTCQIAFAQLKVAHIDIQGNVKTKSYIILRELPYQVGSEFPSDSLVELNKVAQQQLINTSLFYEAQVSYQKLDSQNIDIQIKVAERWYFFPLPYFKWVDRNFSEWWNTQNHSLERVNYGINFRQSNLTGNNDRLTIGLITGYTHQAVLRYQFPYLDKKLRFGMGIAAQYFTQKELNTSTLADKQVFNKTEQVIQKGYKGSVSFFYRPNLYERHTLQVGVGHLELSDSALLFQPAYLPNHGKSFTYLDLNFSYTKVKFDYNAYPTEGNSNELGIYQRLSAQNNLTAIQFRKVYAHRFTASNFYLLESNSLAKIMPNQNYLDSRLLGYGNMQMNGFEYYVVDGNAGSLMKASIHQRLGTIRIPKKMGIGFVDKINKHLPDIKFQFWLKAFTNLGYVYSEHPTNESRLSNTLLRTAGVGLDVLSIYDMVVKFDYSVNQLGDKGLYLHAGINF
jgi:outer membrane protein assembly factor BamA